MVRLRPRRCSLSDSVAQLENFTFYVSFSSGATVSLRRWPPQHGLLARDHEPGVFHPFRQGIEGVREDALLVSIDDDVIH